MTPPRIKSTQHPDNITIPPFTKHDVMTGEDEIAEAFLAYSEYGCGEQLWDVEGKDADMSVVKKLLAKHETYFKEHVLGRDRILSIRVPNPRVEHGDAKILLEALYSITRGYDVAKRFYGEDAVPPIGEVYVPMVQEAEDVLRVQRFYEKYIIAEQDEQVAKGVTIRDWLGPFGPARIMVTPLCEDKESILNAHKIAEAIIKANKPKWMRFWLARSDPAMNYGNPATVLMLKIALQRLHEVEKRTGVAIYPTLGLGSAPFRGNFRPDNAKTILQGYPSVQTFTVQSSFKYDHPLADVKKAIALVNATPRGPPNRVDEKALLPIIEKLSKAFQEEIVLLAPLINRVAAYVPARRMRKMHVGLFGYARGEGLQLPRAITFTAALYSIGLPPELLSLSVLSDEDLETIRHAWANFTTDYAEAASRYDPACLPLLPPLVRERVERTVARVKITPDKAHRKATTRLVAALQKGDEKAVRALVVEAAQARRFLG